MIKKIFMTLLLTFVSLNAKSSISINHNPHSGSQYSNYDSCKLTLEFNSPIAYGDQLTVKSSGHIVFKIKNNSKETINKILTYIRAIHINDGDTVTAELVSRSGKTTTASIRFLYAAGGEEPDLYRIHKNSNYFDNRVQMKQKPSFVKLHFHNSMNREKYVDTIALHNSQGEIIIETTPLIAKNPIFALYTKESFEKFQIDLHTATVIYPEITK